MAEYINFTQEILSSAHSLRRDTTSSTSTGDTQHLSQAAFANPIDFLTTLRSILPKANPDHPNDVSKKDLLNFAWNSDNAKEKAAASIAAAHYDLLREMPKVFHMDYLDKQGPGLSDKELQLDLDMASGNTGKDVQHRQNVDAMKTAWFGGAAVFNGIVAAASVEVPPLSVLAGVGAVGAVTCAILDGREGLSIAKDAETASLRDRQMLAGWSEINGAK